MRGLRGTITTATTKIEAEFHDCVHVDAMDQWKQSRINICMVQLARRNPSYVYTVIY